MKYIVFGCGNAGKEALRNIGEDRVVSFASNHSHAEPVCGKRVLSFQEMVEIYEKDEEITIIIAANGYWKELEIQARDAGIQRYFIYHRYTGPYYMRNLEAVFPTPAQALGHYGIKNYHRIAIYGNRVPLALLISEIHEQSPAAEIFIAPWGDEEPETSLVPHISIEDARKTIDCLIINIPRVEIPAAIRKELDGAPFAVADLYAVEQFDPAFHYEGMERFKNIHAGERVFVIGTGPSLTVGDLNTLHEHGEICIGANKVYRVYDRTPWRANYLVMSDWRIIEDSEADIPDLPGQLILADSFHFYPHKRFPNVQYYHFVSYDPLVVYDPDPGFSEDPARCMYDGGTVIYNTALQMAAYMGFKEVYLLGLDHGMRGSVDERESHFIPEYTLPQEAEKYKCKFPTRALNSAYEKAERYSRQHGFRIFNATRGGKLEVFERVDFDSLF